MTTLKKNPRHISSHWAWLLPILALSPLSLAAKGCSNDGTVGDDCPTASACSGNAGSNGNAGSGNGHNGKSCGGLIGAQCDDGEFCKYDVSAACGAADQTGVCTAKPQACDLSYSPMCGCDGKTYGNTCAADAEGVSIKSKGECGGNGSGGSSGSGGAGPGPGGVCGGITGKLCGSGEFCDYPAAAQCGSGDQQGTCKPKPEICTEIYAPVCGCDGKTYSSDCVANGAGVSVASEGECQATGKACGARAGDTCAADEYCAYKAGQACGRADAEATCVKIPKGQACDAVYAPVCGCDGKTYSNDCVAATSGAGIDHEGPCGGSGGKVCGGFAGTQCEAGFYCEFPADMMCGIADGTGTCVAKPDACTANLDPVCGCDGKDYGNACAANAAGTSVASKGKCK